MLKKRVFGLIKRTAKGRPNGSGREGGDGDLCISQQISVKKQGSDVESGEGGKSHENVTAEWVSRLKCKNL